MAAKKFDATFEYTPEASFKEIAQELGVSEQRAYEIYCSALLKLQLTYGNYLEKQSNEKS